MTGYVFNRFLSISPDGRYLVYSISGYELSAAYLLTVET